VVGSICAANFCFFSIRHTSLLLLCETARMEPDSWFGKGWADCQNLREVKTCLPVRAILEV
jgi:hypothetical protein